MPVLRMSFLITAEMDFEAARRNADERLNQELVRIRNLPKRSKIKVANKYGLKHASHTNAGLVKELEINLGIISREQRRVANECSKRQRDFRETQKKSLSKFLPPLGPQENLKIMAAEAKVEAEEIRTRRITVADQAPMWLKDRTESIAEFKRERLIEMTARSKKKTLKIISENNKKTSIGAPLPPLRDVELDENSLLTRLNRRRKNAFAGSCFPFLLEDTELKTERENQPVESLSKRNREWLGELGPNQDASMNRARTFRGVTYEKVIKMPDPAKIPHLDPRNPKLYQVVMRVYDRNCRKISRINEMDAEIARKNTVFTKHWK